jgi:hypothetical protein
MAGTKELHFDVDARGRLKRGVDQLSDAVKGTRSKTWAPRW